MKINRLLTAILACVIVATATGCKAEPAAETEAFTTKPIGFAREREGDDAYAIDKMLLDPLPGDAVYRTKTEQSIEIMAGEWDCNIGGSNYKDQYQELPAYAETLMANYVITYKYRTSDVIWEDPVQTTVGGYDAVLYNFVIQETRYETDTNGTLVTDANGTEISYNGRHFTGRAYFFFSGADAYYMIFTCLTEDYAACAPEWDQLVANVTIDEDLKLSEATTVSALNIITEETTSAEISE
jgi:hypothetical protein